MSGDGSTSDFRSYYGRPVLKEPVWTWEVPAYFFVGGTAGAAAALTLTARLAGNERLARTALYVDLAGVAISPALLVSDLGRPGRFLNMLRVFKVTSPMSVGSWVLAVGGGATAAAAACDLLNVLPRLRLAAEVAAGALGPLLSTYTGALVADTAIPVWHEARRELPFVFAGASGASAGGILALLTRPGSAGPARRLGVAGGLVQLAASAAMERRLGFLAEPYRTGKAGAYERISRALTAAGAALTAVAGRRRAGAIGGGLLLCSGAACKRFAVYHAGFQSAADPKYTVVPQRRRLM